MLALSLALSLAAFSSCEREAKRYEASFLDVFDTFSQVIVYSADGEFAQRVVTEAYDELRAYHQLYDIYNEYEGLNNLKTVNDMAGVAPVEVDARIIELLLYAKEMHRQTDGRMNVAMGSVLKLWHDSRSKGLADPASARVPSAAALSEAAKHTSIDDVVLDENKSTVYLADAKMRLDVGAVAKGYAVEQVARSLQARGVNSALLSIGGNVRAIGVRGDGTRWRVGVQDPSGDAEGQNIAMAALDGLSLVSSGDYQRFYTVDGVRYHHIIDPDTLMPASYFSSVSIVAEDSALADALSTALFTTDLKHGQEILSRFKSTEALWTTSTGELIRSEGFAELAREGG